jgi:hypothetical protein
VDRVIGLGGLVRLGWMGYEKRITNIQNKITNTQQQQQQQISEITHIQQKIINTQQQITK